MPCGNGKYNKNDIVGQPDREGSKAGGGCGRSVAGAWCEARRAGQPDRIGSKAGGGQSKRGGAALAPSVLAGLFIET